jgi:hypothetical protein
MRLHAALKNGLDSGGSRKGLHVERNEPSVLNTNAAVALFVASECFPSGDGEKYTPATTKFNRNPLIPKTPI